LNNKNIIECKLVIDSHTTVGHSIVSLNPSIKVSQYRIYWGDELKIMIPGSTIKGILRQISSRIAYMHNLKTCKSIEPEEMVKIKNCSICDMFGMPNKPSKIIVSNAVCDSEIIPLIQTRIRINKSKGKTEEGALFTMERLPKGLEFEFKIYFKDLSEKQLELLVHALSEMRYHNFGASGGRVYIKVEKFPSQLETDIIKNLLEMSE